MFYSAQTDGFYTPEIHGDTIPGDAVEITDEQYTALLDGQSQGRVITSEDGYPILSDPVPPTTEQLLAQYTSAVQQRLDAFARTRGYDGILSAATYATSTIPKFSTEGQYAVTARDATWTKCYEILGEFEAGARPMPTLEEILSELPLLEWPTSV